MTTTKTAVSLFSGGKDSTYALYKAQEEYDVDTLVTVHAEEASKMYHVPAIELTSLAADAMKVDRDLVTVETREDEISPLRETLEDLSPDAVVVGAVESEYQRSRIEGICDEIGAELVAPLWHCDTSETMRRIVEEFEVMVIGVAAYGLDESWLGRVLDSEDVDELERLNDEYGVHIMGEGGEFETMVLGGSQMESEIEVEYEKDWDGMRGELRIEDACLV
ncbi:MAG: diphthine--ammonia ligase [Halobacteria archaeon]|nr:diphthine--ammonia ligase [Halobacteria archaeon]